MILHGTMMSWTLVCALGVFLASSADGRQGELQIGKKVGQVYPDIELPTIDGASTIRLSSLRGKRFVLIEFASW